MKLHDVSVLISEDLPIWPGDPGISMTLSSSLHQGDDANVTRLAMGVHTGTHIDAPFHFEPEGMAIDQLPIDILIGPCQVFDVPDIKGGIGPDDLLKLDNSAENIGNQRRVFNGVILPNQGFLIISQVLL